MRARAEVTVSNTSLLSGGAPVVGARVSCHPIRLWPRHQPPAVISIYHIWRASDLQRAIGKLAFDCLGRWCSWVRRPLPLLGTWAFFFPPSRPEMFTENQGDTP